MSNINKLASNFVWLLVFCFSASQIIAQNINWVPMDEQFQLSQNFHNTDTILLLYSKKQIPTKAEKELIESYVFWQNAPIYIYKEQAEFTDADTSFHIQIWGSIKEFSNPYFANIPIKCIKKGFSFKNIVYESEGDAFFYIHPSAKLMYTCFNSIQAYSQLVISGMGAYPLNIMRNNELVVTGFSPDSLHTESFNQIDLIREEYFVYKKLKGLDLYVAKTLNYDSVFIEAEKYFNEYVVSFCLYLNVKSTNLEPIKAYVYNNRVEMQQFLAVPSLCIMYGKSVGNVIHSCDFNWPVLQHETGHSIINQKVGTNMSAFWSEGFRQYTEYMHGVDTYNADLQIVSENIILLNDSIINDYKLFYQNWNNYNISGVFVQYVIDRIGLKAFKKAYCKNQITEVLYRKTGSTLISAIEECKNQIQTCKVD